MSTATRQSWQDILAEEKSKPYFQQILAHIDTDITAGEVVYPAKDKLFNAFKLTPYQNLKVIIIGQDPYHGPGQAHGLSFSVPEGVNPPPSLQNIFKELKSDLGIDRPNHGCLTEWASQGVLLLNSVLSVLANKPGSHANIGWQQFTDTVIERLNDYPERLVYLLWGAYARQKQALIDNTRHSILQAAHPSPFSFHRGFAGCKHFSKANQLLQEAGREPIHWALSPYTENC